MKTVNKIIQQTNTKSIILGLILLVLTFCGLIWLCVIILLGVIFYYLISKMINKIRNNIIRSIISISFLIIVIFISTITFRLLIFDIYEVPSSSMKDVLSRGDVILVNKLSYGPKPPSSIKDIPWINIFYYLSQKKTKGYKKRQHDFKRFSGISEIKQGDIFVFTMDLWDQNKKTLVQNTIVKRCLGLPGDELHIKEGKVITNHRYYRTPGSVRHEYFIWTQDRQKFLRQLDSLSISWFSPPGNEPVKPFRLSFSIDNYKKIKKLKITDSLAIVIEGKENNSYLLSEDMNPHWTLDNFGSVKVPQKGMKIELNKNTFSIYKKALRLYEPFQVDAKEDGYYINGKKETSYTFKNDYYFMMGDNRKNSRDSRVYGFVPKPNIIGKVQAVISRKK